MGNFQQARSHASRSFLVGESGSISISSALAAVVVDVVDSILTCDRFKPMAKRRAGQESKQEFETMTQGMTYGM